MGGGTEVNQQGKNSYRTVKSDEPIEVDVFPKTEWVTMRAAMPAAMSPLWEICVTDADKAGITHEVEAVRNGAVIEFLIANYLAGGRHVGSH